MLTCIRYTCSHVKTVLMIIFDPLNIGLEAIIVQLSGELIKDMTNTDFCIMASLFA